MVRPLSKAQTPPFNNHDSNLVVLVIIDSNPITFISTIAFTVESGFIVDWNLHCLVGFQFTDDILGQGDVMGAWLATVLEQWIASILACKVTLRGVSEIQVIEGEGYGVAVEGAM